MLPDKRKRRDASSARPRIVRCPRFLTNAELGAALLEEADRLRRREPPPATLVPPAEDIPELIRVFEGHAAGLGAPNQDFRPSVIQCSIRSDLLGRSIDESGGRFCSGRA